jgi:glycosyltransferase involved in cell wall biosynthesis
VSEWVAYNQLGIKAVNINNGVGMGNRAHTIYPPCLREKTASILRIVTCGRITHQKDPALFNRIAKYFEDLRGYEFIWIGDGEARSLLTSANITITGWMPIAQTRQMLETTDVYLSTSHFEGLPFAVLEALLLGKPVLLKDCIGNRDIVIDGINGNLFTEAEEAITKILFYANNRAMLPVMGEYSRRHCLQQFNVNTTYIQYRSLYQSF